jgi:hypothetical protein
LHSPPTTACLPLQDIITHIITTPIITTHIITTHIITHIITTLLLPTTACLPSQDIINEFGGDAQPLADWQVQALEQLGGSP